MDDTTNGFVCWLGSIHALWAALEPSGMIESFSCSNGDICKCNNLWSMLATNVGSSRASVTRSSAVITHKKSTDTTNSVSLRRNARRTRGKEDGEDNGGPGDARGQPKVDGGDEFRLVIVGSVEDLENLDPNVVMLSIDQNATNEAASEILREGNQRGFQFAKNRPYYKAVYACILENTQSEEKDGLDPDYHPSEEYDSGVEEEVLDEGRHEQLENTQSEERDPDYHPSEEYDSGVEEELSDEGRHEQIENTQSDERDSLDHPSEEYDSGNEEEVSGEGRDEQPLDWVMVEESDYFEPVPLEAVLPQPSDSAQPSPPDESTSAEPVPLEVVLPQPGDSAQPSPPDESTSASDLGQSPESSSSSDNSPPPPPPSSTPPASSAGPVVLGIGRPQGDNSSPPPPPPPSIRIIVEVRVVVQVEYTA